MSTQNDTTILALKKKIEEKKALLVKADKFVPITNCSLEYLGQRYNLNVLTKDQIIPLIASLMSASEYAKVLDMTCELSGYDITQWICDLISRLNYITRKAEQDKLAAMERKLTGLLSSDKQVELELASISKLLE